MQIHKASAEQEQQQSDSANQSQEQEQQQTQQDEGQWISIDLSDNATTFDLLKIRGIEQYLGTSEIEAGRYTQVRLIVDTVKVALGGGELQDAEVPSKKLKLVHPFDIIAGETTAMVLDFDADRMVTVTGSGKIIVKPVIKIAVEKEKTRGPKGEKKQGKAALEDTIWVLESYGDPSNLNTVTGDKEITVKFVSADGKMQGSAGCNSYFGSYEVNKDKLTIKPPIGSTMMACPEPIMNQEAEYLAILQNAESYSIESDQLTIVSGGKVLTFERK